MKADESRAYTKGFADGFKRGREDAVSEAESKIKAYASVWMEYTDSMSKEEIAQEALNSAKDAMIQILEQMRSRNDGRRSN